MRSTIILTLIGVTISSVAQAAPDCDNKADCVQVTGGASLRATLENKCGKPVRCELCPVYGRQVDATHCGNADIETDASASVTFKKKPMRSILECFSIEDLSECQPGKPAPRPPPDESDRRGPRSAQDQEIDRLRDLAGREEEPVQHAPSAARPKITRSSNLAWAGSGGPHVHLESLLVGLFASASSTVLHVTTTTSNYSFGMGLRLMTVGTAVPDIGQGESSWVGFRAGVGVDFGFTYASSSTSSSFSGSDGASSSATFGMTQIPLTLGVQTSIGSFTDATHWDGWTFGLDYQPRATLSPGFGFAPVAFNLHFESATYVPDSVEVGFRPHFMLNAFLIAPVADAVLSGGFGIGISWQ